MLAFIQMSHQFRRHLRQGCDIGAFHRFDQQGDKNLKDETLLPCDIWQSQCEDEILETLCDDEEMLRRQRRREDHLFVCKG